MRALLQIRMPPDDSASWGPPRMADTATPPRTRSRIPPPRPFNGSGPPGRGRRWSQEPHHRRRRALAVLAILLLTVIVVLVAGSGGGGSAPAPVHGGGLLTRIQTLAGNGPTSFAAVETAAENAAINRTLAYTPYVRVAGSQHRELALTFDDGPGPYTEQVVSILTQMSVPATFFEVGLGERYFSAGTRDIVDHRFAIGDHTYSHAPMSQLSPSDQRAQLLGGARAIGRYGAPFPRLFRPPYGLWNGETIALLRSYRMLMILWTVDTSDYRLPGTDSIINTVVSGAQPGAIFLLHDAGGNRAETVAALPKIIESLRARGYKFVTVPKLLLDNPPPANQQISSVSGSGG
jgi:peptidoglycan-N-acetylglucosamine deacetylase